VASPRRNYECTCAGDAGVAWHTEYSSHNALHAAGSYDPYYCDGAAKRRLVAMGFRATIHENRDFYADVDAGSVPTHDVLMTNPPFSGDHIERLVRFVTRGAGAGRRLPSFALLVPSYVIGKPYWRECVKSLAPPPFVVAAQR